MKNLVFIIILFSTRSYSVDQGFEYRIPRYPVSTEACPETARLAGVQFEKVTGRRVLKTACESRILREWDLVISYEGEFALNLVSTFDKYSHDQGFYPTKNLCLESIRPEVQKYETYTGLKAVIAYCYSHTSLSSDHPNSYVLRIDGFGTPNLRPIVFNRNIYAKPLEPLNTIAESIRSSAEAQGLVAPQVLVDNSGGLYRLIIKYYSKRAKPIQFAQFTSYETPEQCTQRIAEARNIFKEIAADPMFMLCAQKDFSYTTRLYSLLYIKGSFKKITVPSRYNSMIECDSDKTPVIEWYRGQDLDVAGSLCGYQDDLLDPKGVSMDVFVRQ